MFRRCPTPPPPPRAIRHAAAALAALCLCPAAGAQLVCTDPVTNQWNTGLCSGGPWTTPECWIPGTPTPASHALVDSGAPVIVDGGLVAVDTLTLGHGTHIAIYPGGLLQMRCLNIHAGRLHVHGFEGLPSTGAGVSFTEPVTARLATPLFPYGQIFLDAPDPDQPDRATLSGAPLTLEGYVQLFGNGQVHLDVTNNTWLDDPNALTGVYSGFAGDTLRIINNATVNNARMGAFDGGTLELQSQNLTQGVGAEVVAERGGIVRISGGNVSGGFVARDSGLISHSGGSASSAVFDSTAGGMLEWRGGIVSDITILGPSRLLPPGPGCQPYSMLVTSDTTIVNEGSMEIVAVGTGCAGLHHAFASALTIDGGGEIVLNSTSDAAPNAFISNGSGIHTLTHGAMHTIRGTGQVSLSIFINGGLVVADRPGRQLTLAANIQNNSTLQGAAGLLVLTGGSSITQAPGARILATRPGAGSPPYSVLIENTPVYGGTLEAAPGARIALAGQVALHDNVRILGECLLQPPALGIEQTPIIGGLLTNDGRILVHDGVAATGASLYSAGFVPTTIAGAGEIVLQAPSEDALNLAVVSPGNDDLILGPSQVLRGTGYLGNSSNGSLINQGQIVADAPMRTITQHYRLDNLGTIAARNGGILRVGSPRGGVGAGGELHGPGLCRAEAGSLILLSGGSFLVDASLRGDGGGRVLFDQGSFSGTYVYGPLTLGGSCAVAAGTTIVMRNLDTTITDGALTINDGSGAGTATVSIDSSGPYRLEGSGRTILSTPDTGPSRASIVTYSEVVIGPQHTLAGRGQVLGSFGGGALTIEGALEPGLSAGIIDCTVPVALTPGSVLRIELGGTAPGSEHDKVMTTQRIDLAGALAVSLIGGFVPQFGQQFEILRSGGGFFAPVAGAFGSIALPPLPAGGTGRVLRVVYGQDFVKLVCTCPADFTGDLVANSQDLFDFLAAFFAADPRADVNRDNTVNSQDFFDFLTAFFGRCD